MSSIPDKTAGPRPQEGARGIGIWGLRAERGLRGLPVPAGGQGLPSAHVTPQRGARTWTQLRPAPLHLVSWLKMTNNQEENSSLKCPDDSDVGISTQQSFYIFIISLVDNLEENVNSE